MSNPVCIECGVEMMLYKAGTAFLYHDNAERPCGYSYGDIYQCPSCKQKIGSGFGRQDCDEQIMVLVSVSYGTVKIKDYFKHGKAREKKYKV